MRKNANFYSGMFAVIAVAIFLATLTSRLMFAIAGERLTERIRKKAFRAYLRQEPLDWPLKRPPFKGCVYIFLSATI